MQEKNNSVSYKLIFNERVFLTGKNYKNLTTAKKCYGEKFPDLFVLGLFVQNDKSVNGGFNKVYGRFNRV